MKGTRDLEQGIKDSKENFDKMGSKSEGSSPNKKTDPLSREDRKRQAAHGPRNRFVKLSCTNQAENMLHVDE